MQLAIAIAICSYDTMYVHNAASVHGENYIFSNLLVNLFTCTYVQQ